MNAQDFVETVANKTGFTKVDAKAAVDAVFGTVEEALRHGEEVKLGAVGKLLVKQTKARVGKGFGEEIQIPAQRAVRFKQFAGMRARLNAA